MKVHWGRQQEGKGARGSGMEQSKKKKRWSPQRIGQSVSSTFFTSLFFLRSCSSPFLLSSFFFLFFFILYFVFITHHPSFLVWCPRVPFPFILLPYPPSHLTLSGLPLPSCLLLLESLSPIALLPRHSLKKSHGILSHPTVPSFSSYTLVVLDFILTPTSYTLSPLSPPSPPPTTQTWMRHGAYV